MKPMIIPEEFWVGSPVIVTVHGHELKGQVLGCFCKPKACHLDIVVDWLNEQ